MQVLDNRSGRSFFERCKCGGNRGQPTSGKCQNITVNDPIQKPDLAIYSQLEELQNGNIPSWDSSDIITNNFIPFRLLEEAKVKVRNLSSTVPAINTSVHYYIAPFGIGTRKELKLTKIVNIPQASEVELTFPLDQITLGGDPRVGVHIQIEHPFDPNLINNFGSQIIDGGYTTESGRNFSIQIPVFNDSNFSRQINLSIMPTDVISSVTPISYVFASYEQIITTLKIQIPGFLHGSSSSYIERAVTVVGRLSGGELIGGATRLIRIDD